MTTAQITLSRELKIRLLKAIRVGSIDMAKFPELRKAQESIRIDISRLTPEEKQILLQAARIKGRYQ